MREPADGGVGVLPDAAPSSDAGPNDMTFSVAANECDNSRCTGGYNGAKTTSGPPTANRLCIDHAFARSTSYTISTTQPGGRFCTWNPTTMQFGCDSSCSGCNAIDSVVCTQH